MMLKQRKSEAWRRFGYLVLISIDFDDFTSPFTLKFLFQLRRYIKHSRQCFIDWLSKQLEFRQKYSAVCRIFNSPLGVCISQWNTVSRVWYTTWTLYGAAKFKLSWNFVFHCKAIHVGSFPSYVLMQYCEFRWISLVDLLEFKQPTQMKFQSVSNYAINYMCSLERHFICL